MDEYAELFAAPYPLQVQQPEKAPDLICVLDTVGLDAKNAFELQNVKYMIASPQSALIINNSHSSVLFVMEEFESQVFHNIAKSKNNSILGSTAVIELGRSNLPIVPKKNNVYCLSMDKMVFYLSTNEKEVARRTMKLIRYMGGSVRDCLSRHITHVISNSVLYRSYEYASLYSVPVMKTEWVEQAWQKRNIIGFKADCEQMMKFKLQLFSGCYINFSGFSVAEEEHLLITKVQDNDGVVVSLEDGRCTHVVIDTLDSATTILRNSSKKYYLVYVDWFLTCISQGYKLPEEEYLVKFVKKEDACGLNRLFNEQNQPSASCEPNNEIQHSCLQNDKHGCYLMSNDAELNNDINQHLEENDGVVATIVKNDRMFSNLSNHSSKELSNPQIIEFLHTEERYRNVLQVILEIKRMATNKNTNGESILDKTEERAIFGNIEAINGVHTQLFEDVSNLKVDRVDDFANVIVNYKPHLLQHYPQFCDGFEVAQTTLLNCCKSKPKFKQLLEDWQNDKQCRREHLSELLIRPIQRLGSVLILLKEIQKSLPINSNDDIKIKLALAAIQEVLNTMNDNKKKTEILVATFKTYNSIRGCPVDLISSQRTLYFDFFAQSLTDTLSKTGDVLALFVFSDLLEVAKVKQKLRHLIIDGHDALKEAAGRKPFTHISSIPLSDIRRIINICDGNQNQSFAIVSRKDTEIKETFHMLLFKGGEEQKTTMIDRFAKSLATFNSCSNADVYVQRMSHHEMQIISPQVVASPAVKRCLFK